MQRSYDVEKRLLASGWQNNSLNEPDGQQLTASNFMMNYDTFTAGYSSSAIYGKSVGPVTCILNLSGPEPEHFSAEYTCYQDFTYFGDPYKHLSF